MSADSSSDSKKTWIRVALALVIVLPLFFQLQGTIYHSPKVPLYDSGGNPYQVPLPISIIACIAGPLLIARFGRAFWSFAVLAMLCAAMVVATIIATFGSASYGLHKILVLIQFLLPASALVLGSMFESARGGDRLLARSFGYFLACFVAAIVWLSNVQGTGSATWNMEIFSIYQHRQYVPVIFVAAYLVSLFSLWESQFERPLLIFLGLVLGAYAGLSFSILALALLVTGILAFALVARQPLLAGAIMVLCALGIGAKLWGLRDIEEFRVKFLTIFQGPQGLQLPGYASDRLKDWTLYSRGIMESGKGLLFGHAEPFDRAVSTSAHNYYLDFAYNFGVIALLPLLGLIAYTLWLLVRERRRLRADLGTSGLALVVLFIVLVDSNLKVTLRQPYPGIFCFFLWGVLLARLREGPGEPGRR